MFPISRLPGCGLHCDRTHRSCSFGHVSFATGADGKVIHMPCCDGLPCSIPPNPFAGIETPLPSASLWFNNPELARIRNNQAKLNVGDTDSNSSDAVNLIQLVLRHWGTHAKHRRELLLPAFGADGAFGNETKGAVSAFQRENKGTNGVPLVPDSVLGYKTLAAVDRLLYAGDPRVPNEKPSLIDVKIDFVHFPDGFRADKVRNYLRAGNQMYNKVGISFSEGRSFIQHDAGPAACDIFEKNLSVPHKKGKLGSWCTSKLQLRTITHGDTPELDRLLKFRPSGLKQRITVYHVASFPDASPTPWGFSVTMGGRFPAFGIAIANWPTSKSYNTFWHELGHCLINRIPGEYIDGSGKDHSYDFLARPSPRSLEISPVVAERMRETAQNILM